MACAVCRRESSARSRSMRLRAFSKSAWRRTRVWRISLSSACSLATLPSRTSRSSSSLASAEEASPADGSSASDTISIFGSGDFFLSFSNTLASSSQKLRFVERLPEQLRHVGHRRHGALILHAHRPENAERTLHVVAARVGGADQSEVLSGRGHLIDSNLHVDRLRRVNADVEQSHQAVLFLNGREQFAQLRLVGKLGGGGNLRRALHVHLLRRGIRQQGWIAKSQGVAGDLLVALALLRQLGH